MRGRPVDWAVAGAGLGLAAATKYTAGIVVLPLVVAAAFRLVATGKRAPRPCGAPRSPRRARPPRFLVANPHALLSFDEFWSDVRKQEEAASGFGKLGLDYDSGVLYYLWVLTWGFGWVPLAAALGGARASRFARTCAAPCSSCRGRCVFLALHGTAGALLRALAAARASRRSRSSPGSAATRAARPAVAQRRPRAARGGAPPAVGCALAAQGLDYSVHVDRVLSRDDTRNLARAWMAANMPAGVEGRGRAGRPRRLVRRRRRARRGRRRARAA